MKKILQWLDDRLGVDWELLLAAAVIAVGLGCYGAALAAEPPKPKPNERIRVGKQVYELVPCAYRIVTDNDGNCFMMVPVDPKPGELPAGGAETAGAEASTDSK